MLTRYTLAAMRHLWGREETKFEFWLKVELAILKARVQLGDLSLEAFNAISKNANFTVARINELEAMYDQDMIAFVVTVQESLAGAGVGEFASELHKGVTSYDIEDPALILMLKEANALVLEELRKLKDALLQKAKEHRWTLMIARTHGQYAEPTTFGQLLLVYAEAVQRSIARIEQAELNEGKISGAVGTYAGIDPEIELVALRELGLTPARAETQILQRDRHAAYLANLAVVAATIEQMCRTFWEMMRSDAHELEEPRSERQRGSSAMSHKKNPILTERLMGLSRMIRACAHVAMENVATPEARDISQSSVERHIFPDATSLVHYMASRATNLVARLVVFKDRMRENLEHRTYGVWATQQVRVALMDAGVSYDAAYVYTQQAAFNAIKRGVHIREVFSEILISREDPRTAIDVLGERELVKCFDADSYVRAGIEVIFLEVDASTSQPR